MHSQHIPVVISSITAIFASQTGGSSHAQPHGVIGYEATSMGVLGSDDASSARAIDECGRLHGTSGRVQADLVVWTNGQLLRLKPPPGFDGALRGDFSPTSGIVVGGAWGDQPGRAVVWTMQRTYLLPNLPGELTSCEAARVNDRHQIVGDCTFPNRSVLWVNGEPHDLGTLGREGGAQAAIDINERNEIVGWSENADGIVRPYLWRKGELLDIGGQPIDRKGEATGINEWTEVVGNLPTQRTAYYWYDNVLSILPEPNPCGALYRVRAINDFGLIVGDSASSSCTEFRATVWDRDSNFAPTQINDLMPFQPEIKLLQAWDVNNAGQVAASGETAAGDERGFLVTPYQFEISEPVPGRAGERNAITVTGLDPNQLVRFIWGTAAGAQPMGGGCPGGTLLIRDPRTNGALTKRADEFGVVEFNLVVPAQAAGRRIVYQAIAPDECEVSHTVEFRFDY